MDVFDATANAIDCLSPVMKNRSLWKGLRSFAKDADGSTVAVFVALYSKVVFGRGVGAAKINLDDVVQDTGIGYDAVVAALSYLERRGLALVRPCDRFNKLVTLPCLLSGFVLTPERDAEPSRDDDPESRVLH